MKHFEIGNCVATTKKVWEPPHYPITFYELQKMPVNIIAIMHSMNSISLGLLSLRLFGCHVDIEQ